MRCKYRVFLFYLFFVFSFNNLNHHIQQLVCVYVCVLFSSVSFLPLSLSRGFYTLQQSFRFPFFFFIHKNFHREVFQVYPKKTAIPALVNSWFASLLSLFILRLILLGCWPRQPPVYSQFSLLLFKRTHKVERTHDQKAPLSLFSKF